MKTLITGHNMDVTESLRELTEKKLQKLESHADNIDSVEVTLQVENLTQIAKANVDIPGCKVFHASAESKDMYKSIDLLVGKIKNQIDRYKEKLADRG